MRECPGGSRDGRSPDAQVRAPKVPRPRRARHALHTRCTRAARALQTRYTRAAPSSATQSVRRSLSSKGKREGGGHDSRASAPCGAHGPERGQIRGRADAPRRAQVPRQSVCARRRGHRCPFPSPCTSPARRPLTPYPQQPRTPSHGGRRTRTPSRNMHPRARTRPRRQAGRLRMAQVYVHDDAYVLSERTQATPCPSAARYAAWYWHFVDVVWLFLSAFGCSYQPPPAQPSRRCAPAVAAVGRAGAPTALVARRIS
jgi:hypothetical protein